MVGSTASRMRRISRVTAPRRPPGPRGKSSNIARYVVFVVKSEARRAEMRRTIHTLPEEQQEMVRVYLLADLIPQLLHL